MKLMSITKKKVVALGLAGGLAVGMSGVAAAFFTAGGSGSGNAVVTNPVPFTVSQKTTSTNFLTPGTIQVVWLNVHNNSTGNEHYKITHTDITIAKTGTDIVTATSNSKITGCKAAWFVIDSTPVAATGELVGGGTKTFDFLVQMTNGTTSTHGTTQNACENAFPKILVTFT